MHTTDQSTAPGATERRLLDRLTTMRDRTAGWYAVRLTLSRIRMVDLQPAIMALVLAPLRSLSRCYDVETFELQNRDVVVLCRKAPVEDVQSTVEQVCSLLRVDVKSPDVVNNTEASFVSWYDFADGIEAERMVRWVTKRASVAQSVAPPTSAETSAPVPWTPTKAELIALQRRLDSVRTKDFIRQQVALDVSSGARARPIFCETYVSLVDLREALGLGANPSANPWLLRFLTETLDRRMLHTLQTEQLAFPGIPVSINLNLRTADSPEFESFCNNYRGPAGGALFEIQFIDALSEPATFVKIRDRLRGLRFGVVLDGVDPRAFASIDLDWLDPDLVKLWWSDRMAGDAEEFDTDALRHAVEYCGADRVILARVDAENAIKWGNKFGIRRFQGRFIDTIIELEERVRRQQTVQKATS